MMRNTAMHNIKAILMAGGTALALSGCAFGGASRAPGDSSEAEFENLISVGFSQIGSESVWRSANTVSIQETFTAENGYFLQYSNARQKQENQIKAIRSFISQRVDYIVFAPVTEEGWDTVLTEARDAKIPVITSDRTVCVEDETLVTAWVGGDMVLEGENAGHALEALLQGDDEEVRIVVLQGTEGSSAAIGRTEGFHRVCADHPEWRILDEGVGDFTTAKGKEIMQQFLDTYDGIDVVISQNDDMTFGAIEAIEAAGFAPGQDMIIISFDAGKAALELVRGGKINVDVECNPLLGPYVDEVIRALEAGEAISPNNPVEEMVFTLDNVDAYIDSRTY